MTHLLLDLERMLEDHERAITMLRRLKAVLDQLERLGAGARDRGLEIPMHEAGGIATPRISHEDAHRSSIGPNPSRCRSDGCWRVSEGQGAVHALDDLLDELDPDWDGDRGTSWSPLELPARGDPSLGVDEIPQDSDYPFRRMCWLTFNSNQHRWSKSNGRRMGLGSRSGRPRMLMTCPKKHHPSSENHEIRPRTGPSEGRGRMARLDAERIVGDPNEFNSFSDIDL